MSRPSMLGLWHVALSVPDLEGSLAFYRDTVGLAVEWQPDADNVYLTSGRDNLALHRSREAGAGALDHIGFALPHAAAVDAWAAHMTEKGIPLEKPVKTHRDGARSLYLCDPDGNTIQIIHHPPISGP